MAFNIYSFEDVILEIINEWQFVVSKSHLVINKVVAPLLQEIKNFLTESDKEYYTMSEVGRLDIFELIAYEYLIKGGYNHLSIHQDVHIILK